MPITNASNLIRFADAGAEIPRWIRKQLQAYGDSESIKAFGHEVVVKCERLIAGGAPSLLLFNESNRTNSSTRC